MMLAMKWRGLSVLRPHSKDNRTHSLANMRHQRPVLPENTLIQPPEAYCNAVVTTCSGYGLFIDGHHCANEHGVQRASKRMKSRRCCSGKAGVLFKTGVTLPTTRLVW
jgi:hypothetical protein